MLNSVKMGIMFVIFEIDDVEVVVVKVVVVGVVKVEEEEEGGVKGKVMDLFGFMWIFVVLVKKSEEEGNKEV